MIEFDANKIKSNASAAVKSALYAAGEKVMSESQKKVPKATGKLAGSAYISVADDNKPACEVGYTAGYAAKAHSKVDFLNSVFQATKDECARIIERTVGEALK